MPILPPRACRASRIARLALQRLAWGTVAGVVALGARDARAEPWGEGAIEAVERFGHLATSASRLGANDALVGSGLQARFMLPVGWGAYYRWTTSTSNARDGADWFDSELAMGVSRRLESSSHKSFWGVRWHLRLDAGLTYSVLDTNERCSHGVVPFAASCTTTTLGRPADASGNALGVEGRLAGTVGVGPFSLGLDIGAAESHRLTTSSGSVAIPTWIGLTTAQIEVGFALPFGP